MSDTAKRIAELEKELAESINGYISRKVIKGKERFYLQWTENGKLKSRYIKAGELEQTKALVERRKSLQAELKKLKATPDGVKSYNLKRKAVRNMQNITGTLMSAGLPPAPSIPTEPTRAFSKEPCVCAQRTTSPRRLR